MSQLPSTAVDLWAGRTTVPVVEIARAAGVPRYDLRTVQQSGLIPDMTRDGRGVRLVVPHDDAVFLLGACLIAVAAGLALVTVVRLMRETGATIGPDGVSIPLPRAVP